MEAFRILPRTNRGLPVKYRLLNWLTLLALLCQVLALGTTAASAHDYLLGDIIVDHPWARASIGQARAGAVYVTLANKGAQSDRLIAATTGAAKKAGLHNHLMQDGIMKMRPLKAIEVAPGEPAVLKPGGLHIMLMGLKAPLIEGTSFPLTLTFEQAGSIEIQVKVQDKAGMTPHKHMKTGS